MSMLWLNWLVFVFWIQIANFTLLYYRGWHKSQSGLEFWFCWLQVLV